MRALIVDDEPIARKILREELEALGVEVAGEAATGDAALREVEAARPDVILLDVQMPAMDGFEMLSRLESDPDGPAIIMVTAYNQHAVEAFEAGAVDYLLKPVSPQRLATAIERVRRTVTRPSHATEKTSHLRDAAAAGLGVNAAEARAGSLRRVIGKVGEEYFLLNTREVLAFEADGDLTWIVTAKGRFLATQNLRALERRLAGGLFRRIHRNALVNLEHIRKMTPISSQRWLVTLGNGQEFVVSKRQARTVRGMLDA